MLFLNLTIRNLLKQKFSSVINILGLALGIGSFVLISVFVYSESRYDRFHEQGENIYRLTGNIFNPNSHAAILPLPFYPVIKENVPEVKEVVRVQGAFRPPEFSTEELSLAQEGVLYVDPEFMTVFSFELASGDLDAFAGDPTAL